MDKMAERSSCGCWAWSCIFSLQPRVKWSGMMVGRATKGEAIGHGIVGAEMRSSGPQHGLHMRCFWRTLDEKALCLVAGTAGKGGMAVITIMVRDGSTRLSVKRTLLVHTFILQIRISLRHSGYAFFLHKSCIFFSSQQLNKLLLQCNSVFWVIISNYFSNRGFLPSLPNSLLPSLFIDC